MTAVTAKHDLLEECHAKLLDEHESIMKDFVTLQNNTLQTEDKLSELQEQFSKQQLTESESLLHRNRYRIACCTCCENR